MPRTFPSRLGRIAAAALLAAGAALPAQAQSSVTVYGSLDQYFNYMRSSSGATVKALEDGVLLRSRLGFRGVEDLGGGMSAKFQLEHGLNADAGSQADGTRFFDRQAWVGLGTPYGDVRLGRQNGAAFVRGGYIDHTTRTMGSMVNNFGIPSRFDNTVSFISNRMGGFQGDVYLSLPEAPVGNRGVIVQAGLDWASGPYRLGYAGLRARPQAGPVAFDRDVVYDNLFANYQYAKGTVYLVFVRSNNSTASAAGINNGAQILNGTGATDQTTKAGGFNTGSNPDLRNFYHVWQLAADYAVSPQLRLGALIGVIDDRSDRDRGAVGGSLTAYYDLSKRTTLVGIVNTLRNDTNGGFRFAASGGVKTTFTSPNDVNGRDLTGVHLGVVHRF